MEETKTQSIVRRFGNKTDLKNTLSYGNGVKNMVGLLTKKGTGLNLRFAFENKSDEQLTIYFVPIITAIGSSDTVERFNSIINAAGLPAGVVFFRDYNDPANPAIKVLAAKSLNRAQIPSLIATELSLVPMQIISMAQNSYNKDGAPETGNNANTVTHYSVSSLRPMKYKDLNLGQFQSAKNLSNNIVKVDFIKENFVCPISSNDFFAIQINGETKIDLTLNIGARDSRPEYFYRQITAGQDLLMEEFGDEVASGCDCN